MEVVHSSSVSSLTLFLSLFKSVKNRWQRTPGFKGPCPALFDIANFLFFFFFLFSSPTSSPSYTSPGSSSFAALSSSFFSLLFSSADASNGKSNDNFLSLLIPCAFPLFSRRWLTFEKLFGDEEGAVMARERAREFVERCDAAGPSRDGSNGECHAS